MARSDCFVSVVAPLWNDEAIVKAFITETIEVLQAHYTNYELVLVDDGSTDGSVRAVSELLTQVPCVRLMRLSRRFGTDIAFSAGLDTAIGDFIVTMVPNSDPPRLIPELVEDCRRGKDILFGVRRNADQDPAWLRAAAKVFYATGRRFFELNIPEHTTYFQVFSRQALNAVIRIKEKYRHLRLLSAYVGYQNRTFTYEPINRQGKSNRRSAAEAVRLAYGLIMASSVHPLRFVSLLGLAASLFIALYVVYIVAIYLFKRDVAPGWTTLSFQISGLFFLVFLILTVLSEYIGYILSELRERPLYYTLEEKISSVIIADAQRRNVVSTQASGDPARE